MNIFEAIRKDHDKQRQLCELVTSTSGESKDRKLLWEQLKKELEIHADAEERTFYSPLIHNDMMQEHARHGIAEHHEMDELIEKIDDTEMDSPAWLVYAKQLCEKVEHHLKDEEHSFFQLAGKVFTEKQKIDIAKDYQKQMQENR
ncbi:hemerythrin HHE cation binding domain-containing protein [Leeuwenhoekiella aestuarii]|uniref:Hemerythrin HHE cation binding domain-containing protein n=1 Tax=Leeuwenhoekiella aestuarii TaxID=2249426 RepID=A0A4Q0NRA8_9FLAO|nr:hemerythrin domain-containing protein [Leeuwenhoekiella aestuarii]RXG11734.1 hemerythrin HHE cation binding domain-containing protein [Leeuwenhoekiella aestuarii]RXG12789.1 hemerythrin HHE cation binding domain-containing protein [Leeuwenhoekiella aestuarii]